MNPLTQGDMGTTHAGEAVMDIARIFVQGDDVKTILIIIAVLVALYAALLGFFWWIQNSPEQ